MWTPSAGTGKNPSLVWEGWFPYGISLTFTWPVRLWSAGYPCWASAGEQVLNVAFGGTLYQDIPSQVRSVNLVKHRQERPEYGTHTITVNRGTTLYGILKEVLEDGDTYRVNSFHHQSVKDVAPGFVVSATAPHDGIVEGIEMKGNPNVIGVQFHPEGPVSEGDDALLPLFLQLVKASR